MREPTKLGAEIKRLRETRGLTQKQFADILGVKTSIIGRLETTKSDVNASTLFRLAEALGVTCAHFEPFIRDEADTEGEPGDVVDPPTPAPTPAKGKKRKPKAAE